MAVDKTLPEFRDWVPVEAEATVLYEAPPIPIDESQEPQPASTSSISNVHPTETSPERPVERSQESHADAIEEPVSDDMALYNLHIKHSPHPSLRINVATSSPFPTSSLPPSSFACTEPDGLTPVYLGSALNFRGSIHPCKIVPHLWPAVVHVPYGGEEAEHYGNYTILPFVPDLMEWVDSQGGRVPEGRLGVVGGVESGMLLYHALARVPRKIFWDPEGPWVPGKAAEHLKGANIAFGGQEHWVATCRMLCWKMT